MVPKAKSYHNLISSALVTRVPLYETIMKSNEDISRLIEIYQMKWLGHGQPIKCRMFAPSILTIWNATNNFNTADILNSSIAESIAFSLSAGPNLTGTVCESVI